MDAKPLNWTPVQAKLFNLLCRNVGKPMSQRDIAKQLEASPTSIGTAVKKLEHEGLALVRQHKDVNVTGVELNRTPKALQLKRAENLRDLYLSGLPEALEEQFPGCTIILFGSYSRGDDTATSDIDIAIIGTTKTFDTKKYDTILGKETIINTYPSWKDVHNELKENLYNGIVLAGGTEL